ncbi:malate:quinone oxidoreductase [Escherichia coli]
MKKVTAMLFSMAVGLNAVSMAAKAKASEEQETDVLLIGGGIMSATLGTYLRELEPEWSMTMVERLEGVAQESSNGWNNAGTGHSALMELNYTPQNADGSISIEKAVAINEAFQISRQFWAHQVERGVLRTPRSFINTVPHMSFVLMNPLMILVKIIKLRWIHILSYDQMVSRKINNQTTRCANSIFYTTLFTNSAPNYT